MKNIRHERITKAFTEREFSKILGWKWFPAYGWLIGIHNPKRRAVTYCIPPSESQMVWTSSSWTPARIQTWVNHNSQISDVEPYDGLVVDNLASLLEWCTVEATEYYHHHCRQYAHPSFGGWSPLSRRLDDGFVLSWDEEHVLVKTGLREYEFQQRCDLVHRDVDKIDVLIEAFKKQTGARTDVAAAKLLGVHPVTLRRWTATGSSSRTPHASAMLLMRTVVECPELVTLLRTDGGAE